jgi:hypothetical protein
MNKIEIARNFGLLIFGFMTGWLFTIYVAGRFDTFGIAANWQSVSKTCFAAVEEQGKLLDRLAKSNEIYEQRLPTK